MKRLLLLLFVIAFSYDAFGQRIDVGDIARIPQWDQMKVLNQDGITNDSDFVFHYQDPCVVHRTGKLEALEKDSTNVLVEYHIEGKNYLGSCPSGALFSITKKQFRELNREYFRTRNTLTMF